MRPPSSPLFCSAPPPAHGVASADFPWWLAQDQNRPRGTPQRQQLLEETGLTDEELGSGTPLLTPEAFANIPPSVQPLVRHWAAQPTDGPEAAEPPNIPLSTAQERAVGLPRL